MGNNERVQKFAVGNILSVRLKKTLPEKNKTNNKIKFICLVMAKILTFTNAFRCRVQSFKHLFSELIQSY